MSLTPNYSVEQVAAALRETPRYVKEKARVGEWPCRRGSRGRVSFTATDFERILELIAVPEESQRMPRLALAPRSRRAS